MSADRSARYRPSHNSITNLVGAQGGMRESLHSTKLRINGGKGTVPNRV